MTKALGAKDVSLWLSRASEGEEGGGILYRSKHGTEVGMEVDSGEGGWGRGVLGKKEKKSRGRERKCRGEKESGEIWGSRGKNKDPSAVQGSWDLWGS